MDSGIAPDRKNGSKASVVWKIFRRIGICEDQEGVANPAYYVECGLCSKTMRQYSSSTSCMRRHIKSNHETELQDLLEPEDPSLESLVKVEAYGDEMNELPPAVLSLGGKLSASNQPPTANRLLLNAELPTGFYPNPNCRPAPTQPPTADRLLLNAELPTGSYPTPNCRPAPTQPPTADRLLLNAELPTGSYPTPNCRPVITQPRTADRLLLNAELPTGSYYPNCRPTPTQPRTADWLLLNTELPTGSYSKPNCRPAPTQPPTGMVVNSKIRRLQKSVHRLEASMIDQGNVSSANQSTKPPEKDPDYTYGQLIALELKELCPAAALQAKADIFNVLAEARRKHQNYGDTKAPSDELSKLLTNH